MHLPHCASLASGEPQPAQALQPAYEGFLRWFRDGLCPWQRLPCAAAATTNHHHILPLEQARAGYWPQPTAM